MDCHGCAAPQGYGQHDSHEAIRFIVNALHDELCTSVPKAHEPGRLRVDDVSEGAGTTKPKPPPKPAAATAGADAGGGAGGDESHAGVAGGGASARGGGSLRAASKVEEGEGEEEVKGGAGSDARTDTATAAAAARAATYSSSIISDLFGGVLLSQVKCLACRTVSTTRDRFYDLQLSIPSRPLTTPPDEESRRRGFFSSLVCTVGRWFSAGDIRIEVRVCVHEAAAGRVWGLVRTLVDPLNSRAACRRHASSLPCWCWWCWCHFPQDCLQNFCQRERLTGQERYYCEKCKTRQDAGGWRDARGRWHLHACTEPAVLTGLRVYDAAGAHADKHFSVLKLPDVLCIALKRFRHDSYWTSKVSTHVQFPLEGLDMAPCVTVVPGAGALAARA